MSGGNADTGLTGTDPYPGYNQMGLLASRFSPRGPLGIFHLTSVPTYRASGLQGGEQIVRRLRAVREGYAFPGKSVQAVTLPGAAKRLIVISEFHEPLMAAALTDDWIL